MSLLLFTNLLFSFGADQVPAPERIVGRHIGVFEHKTPNSWIQAIRYSPSGALLVAEDCPGGTVHFWDTTTGRKVRTIETGDNVVAVKARSSDDCRFLAAYRTGAVKVPDVPWDAYFYRGVSDVRIWDVEKDRLLASYAPLKEHLVDFLALSPEAKSFVTLETPRTGQGQTIAVLWNTKTGKRLTLSCRPYHQEHGYGAFYSFDSKTLFIPAVEVIDKQKKALVGVFDADSGTLKFKLALDAPILGALAEAPHTNRVLLSTLGAKEGGCSLELWDTQTGKKVGAYDLQRGCLGKIAMSQDGKTCAALVITSFFEPMVESLMLFELEKDRLKPLVSIPLKADLYAAAFNPSGTLVAVTSQRAIKERRDLKSSMDAENYDFPVVHLVDVRAKAIVASAQMPKGLASSVSFSPDGQRIAVGSTGKVLIYDLSLGLGGQAAGGVRE